MSEIKCKALNTCLPCDDFPIINHSSEGPEDHTCFGISHFEKYPLLGRPWNEADCGLIICEISEEPCQVIADNCALVRGLNCGESQGNFLPPCPGSPGCPEDSRTTETCTLEFGSPVNGSLTQALAADTKRFVKFTAPMDISVVQSLNFQLNRTGTGTGYAVAAGIYTDASGVPDALVSNSYVTLSPDIKRESPLWYSGQYPGDKPKLTPGSDYWIGVVTLMPIITYGELGSSNQQASSPDAYFDGLSDPFGTPVYEDLMMSAYVCYKTGIYNERQCATDECDDGTQFTFCQPAGTVPGTSVAEANRLALSIAVEQARLRKICFSSIIPVCCLGNVYSQQIVVTGASVAEPLVNLWEIYAGVLPPGLIFNGGAIAGPASITGLATSTGVYGFTIRVTASNGATATHDYVIEVMGITTPSPLPDAAPTVPYSVTLLAGGFSGSLTWEIVSGALPTGIGLSSAGLISGTTTVVGDFTVTVRVTDGQNSCTKRFDLACFTFSGIRINAWKTWCGYKNLLNEFNLNSENTPPPDANTVCDERWLVRTERHVWNAPFEFTVPGNGNVQGVDDTYVFQYNRYDCSAGAQLVSQTHNGEWVGDAYNEALACTTPGCGICPSGCGSGSNPSQPFIWDVVLLSPTQYRVNISFQVNITEAIYLGYQEVTLSHPYSLKNLQDDLVALWANVSRADYPWIDGILDVFSTYQMQDGEVKQIQYSITYPDLEIPGKIYSIDASAYCALTDQPVDPPLLAGDTEYHAGWLFQPTDCGLTAYECVNLVKTVFRFRGLLCQNDFKRPLPTANPPIPCFSGDSCDQNWESGTLTPLLSETLTPLEVLPIAGSSPLLFTTGLRKITQSCDLLEWWTMQEVGNNTVPRVGSKLLIPLNCTETGAGVIQDGVGIIGNGVSLQSPGLSVQTLSSIDEAGLAYTNGVTSRGISISGWFQIIVSPNPDLDVALFSVVSPGWSLALTVSGGVATATIFGGAATGTVSNAFSPNYDWHFFEIYFDAVLNVIGFRIDTDTTYENPVTGGTIPARATGQMVLSFDGGTAFNVSTCVFDEVALWNAPLSAEVFNFLYNSGAGRTYPIT